MSGDADSDYDIVSLRALAVRLANLAPEDNVEEPGMAGAQARISSIHAGCGSPISTVRRARTRSCRVHT